MARLKTADINSERTQAAIDSALRTLDAEGGGIDALADALRDGLGASFAAAVDLIRGAQGRVIVTGMGKSGHVGRKIASTFASTGTPALFVHPGEASHGDLGMIASDDVIIALSWSGETAELKNLTDYSRRFRIGLIAMTANADSTLAKTADVVLVLPQAREACPHNLAPTTSSLMQLALGDALAIALLESRGFTAIDFGLLHPGGKLGALLKTVRDFMHSGEAVPLAPLGTRMSDAILEMSAKGFGCVGITDAGRQTGRHHHRRRPAPPHAQRSARRPRRRRDDARAEDGAARSVDQRDARIAQFDQGDRAVRGRGRQAGRRHPHPRSVARRRGLSDQRARRATASATSPTDGAAPSAPSTVIGPEPTGPVRPGSLPAKIATSGTPSAAARCSEPGIDPDHELRAGDQPRDGIERRAFGHARTRQRGGEPFAARLLGLRAPRQDPGEIAERLAE